MCGWFHPNKMHVDRANLIMRFSIWWSNLEIGIPPQPLESQDHFYNMQWMD